MNFLAEERAEALAKYIIENSCTVRQAAKAFCISKSTVHTDVTGRLSKINPDLHGKVRAVLDINKEERHLRGGRATKEKYSKKKGQSS